jgi:hemoglobin
MYPCDRDTEEGGEIMRTTHWVLSLVLSAGLLTGAWAQQKAAEKSLYERLGGEPAITAVVADFVGRAAADPKVNFFRDGKYKGIDVPRLNRLLVEFIGQATGGPQKYTGRDMKQVHKGMKITDAEFDALAADLAASLDKFKVPAKEKKELLAIVGTTRKDIVEVKSAPAPGSAY